jgi:hypothetical protein
MKTQLDIANLSRELKVRLLIAELALLANQARFVSVKYTSKESGEVARHTLILGASYHKCIEESLLELEIRRKGLSGVQLLACDELIKSFNKTLEAHSRGEQNEDYTKKGMYRHICTGLQMLENDGSLEICGLQHAKKVLTPGTFKQVNSKPLTVAKNELRRLCKVGQYRTLCVDAGNLLTVKINGDTLELE